MKSNKLDVHSPICISFEVRTQEHIILLTTICESINANGLSVAEDPYHLYHKD